MQRATFDDRMEDEEGHIDSLETQLNLSATSEFSLRPASCGQAQGSGGMIGCGRPARGKASPQTRPERGRPIRLLRE